MNDAVNPIPRSEQMLDAIRQMPIFKQLVPAEAGAGLPIPLRRAGVVYAVVPFSGVSRRADGGADIMQPFATITVRWPDFTPVEYVNLRFLTPKSDEEWTRPVGRFPHFSLNGMSVDQYRAERRALLGMYDKLFESLMEGQTLTPEDDHAFKTGLRKMLDPAIEPYYRQLGPSGLADKFCNRFLGEVDAEIAQTRTK